MKSWHIHKCKILKEKIDYCEKCIDENGLNDCLCYLVLEHLKEKLKYHQSKLVMQ